jgi:hypothetical protein
MATKSIFKRWTGSAWVEFYFKTSADLIDETVNYKVMTAAERTAIGTYLTNGFNVATKLVQINAVDAVQDPSKIDRSLIGDISGTYLTKSNPAFTGNLTGSGNVSVQGDLEAIWSGSAYQFQVNSVTGGFTLDSSGGAQLKLDTGSTFNTAVTVGTPTIGAHATTKTYVDALVASGLRWATGGPVVVASTSNVTSLSGLLTIDGITLTEGQRVLIWEQTTTSQNGIYTVSSGAWTKDTTDSKSGVMVFVENGLTYNDWTFQAISDTSWAETSKVDTILAGTSLTKSGNTISVSNGGITNTQIASTTIDLSTKTASFGSLDNANASYDTWLEIASASTSNNLTVKLNNLHASIGLLRGTANYNTDNTETIAGAYDLAEVKNRTYTGTTSTPSGLTLVTGDLYFYELT